jgi:hypothetical protein
MSKSQAGFAVIMFLLAALGLGVHFVLKPSLVRFAEAAIPLLGAFIFWQKLKNA